MKSILRRKHLVFLGVVLIIFATITGVESFRKFSPNESGKWKTYENIRFGYSINYPGDWTEGHIANNGDGRVLHNKDNNKIVVYGTHEPTDFSKMYPGSERRKVKLSSGQLVTIYESGEDESVVMVVIFDTKEDQIALHSEIKDDFYRTNRDTIIKVADTFSLLTD